MGVIGGVVGAVVGAGASMYASKKQSKAAEKAAKIQSRSAKAAISEEQAARDQAVELQKPFREMGLAAIPELQKLTLEGMSPEDVQLSELYKYQQEQGEESINRAAAARGGFGNTATVERIGEFNKSLLAEEIERTSNRQYGRLLDLVNIGRGAATTSGAAGTDAAGNISSLYTNQGANLSNLAMQQGVNQTSMYSNLGALPLQAVDMAYKMGAFNQTPQVTPQVTPQPTTNYPPVSIMV